MDEETQGGCISPVMLGTVGGVGCALTVVMVLLISLFILILSVT